MAEIYKIQNRKNSLLNFNLVFILIIVNVIAFFATMILATIFGESAILDLLALKPSYIVQGKNLWTLATSMFMHLDFSHLFFNMISLFFVGTLLEKIIGKRRFFLFYMASGLFAGLFFALLSGFFGTGIGEKIFGNPEIFGIGASGAIFGIVGILAVLIPRKKIYLIGGPLIAIIIQAIFESVSPENPILNILGIATTIYIFFSMFAIFSFNPRLKKFAIPIELPFWLIPVISITPLIIIGFFVSLPIGNTAHAGGLIAGLIYGFYLKKKYKRKTEYIKQVFT
ncbi:MAG: rhomboid family intramembrane serine protease [Candidatus Nanoarchaeia archaeon]|nr:rhomboid family intramembrane serine protease [Candidatus Nanoarchaeia archaeon]MDD5358023.1 rhomboid family intramembrane serine protease [Candidatus Nanoarchaeia archaeon]MDD5588942.1 rhomboid family intramembrane serine protease [Candidatus Nanoarchaeia archaeon]